MGRHGNGLLLVDIKPMSLLRRADGVERRISECLRRQQIRRSPVDLDRLAVLCHPSLAQCCGPAAEKQRFRRFGGGIDEDGARLGEDPWQFFAQLFPKLVVEVGQRLVQQDEAGILDQRACKRRALLLSPGKIERRSVEIGRQLQKLGGLAHLPVDRLLVLAGNPHRRGDIFVDRHCRVVDELLVDHRDMAVLHPDASDILAVEVDGSGGGYVEPRHQPHERRLAGKRWSQQDVQRSPFKHHVRRMDMVLRPDDLFDVSQFQHSGSRASSSAGTTCAIRLTSRG